MILFEWTILLLLVAVVLSAIARRAKVPYPTLLAVGGAALAFVPGAPHLVLEPELALALFVSPVLLDAAFDTSLRDLGQNWYPVTALVIAAVSVSTAAVAIVAHALVPDMPWPAAVALGAIVAPPDAAAATAVLRQVGLPHRMLVILQGESLLNDASALLLYRVAAGAALAGGFTASQLGPGLLASIVGGVVLGVALAWLYLRLTNRVVDAPSTIVLQFVATFGVWLLANRLQLSAVLTVVAYGVALARFSPSRFPARLRVPSYAVWETAVFVLNVLAFVLIGLQLAPIWTRLSPEQHTRYAVIAASVLATVIVARFAWVMPSNTVARLLARRFPRWRPGALPAPTVGAGLVVSWCGMRGIVSLAAALALPDGRDGTVAFPHRDLIVLSAFVVVVGTLVVQGLTLGPLLRALDLHDDGAVEREVERARVAALRAAVRALDGDGSPAAARLREEYAETLRLGGDRGDDRRSALRGDPLRRRAVAAARSALDDLRARGVIGDDAYHRLEEDLDWQELSAGGGR